MLGWTVFVSLFSLWTFTDHTQSLDAMNLLHARTYFEKDVTYRHWSVLKGGLYAPINDSTPPNPYIKSPNRDIVTDSGLKLTLITPAYMTRQVYDLSISEKGVLGHITSLNPIRPENVADAWETEALQQFEQGIKEVSEVTNIGGKPYLRLIRPLITDESCLQCHEEQGYQVGDIRGGISISVPYGPLAERKWKHSIIMFLGNLTLWLFVLIGIYLSIKLLLREVTHAKLASEQIKEQEATLNSIYRAAPLGLGLVINREFQEINNTFCAMVGYSREELMYQSTRMIYPSQAEFDRVSTVKYGQIKKTGSGSIETRFKQKNGKLIEVLLSSTLVEIDNPAAGATFTALDITERKQNEGRLRLAASVFMNTAEGVVITNPQGLIVDVNRSFTEILGYSLDEVVGKKPDIWASGHHDKNYYDTMWKSLENTGEWRGEIWNRRKDGDIFPEWLTISAVFDDNNVLTHYVGVFSDISHIKRSEEQLHHLAHHDALTNLPNRLLLTERLDQAIKHTQRTGHQLAIIFLDLDNFKHINDSLGHPAGDQLLKHVAEAMLQIVRVEDTVSRIGGDEFIVLLENIGEPTHIAIIAENLVNAINKPIMVNEHEILVSASLGIAIYPRDGQSSASLLSNADAAMYRAKEAGRNTYQFYTEELTRNAFERVLLENNLRKSVKNNELVLHYQPQIDMQSQSIVGIEALVRWQHPDLGMITPGRFIPLAEETDLIITIGNWVLTHACCQAKAWLDDNLEFGRIAINIAGAQIQRGGLLNEVKMALAESQLPPSRLELEVTESFIMTQAEFAINQLEALRQLGITLSIDDFGTGYSSLSYLKQLPVHKLKIDQSFIKDIPTDNNDMAISDAIISMGRSLGLVVIAEGVETQEQFTFLKQHGCDEAQGYLFSHPLDTQEMAKFMTSSKP